MFKKEIHFNHIYLYKKMSELYVQNLVHMLPNTQISEVIFLHVFTELFLKDFFTLIRISWSYFMV